MPILFKIILLILLIVFLFGFFFTEKYLQIQYRFFSWHYKLSGIDAKFKTKSPTTVKITSLIGIIFVLLIYFSALEDIEKKKLNTSTAEGQKTEVTETINLEDPDMKTVYDFLKKCETYYLATVENDQPRVRPFGTIDLFEDKLYIQTGKVKNVSKQMAKNPKVEICAFDGSSWIRIEATVVNDDRIEAKQHMLDNYPSLRQMYKADDNNTQVLYLKDATATFYSFGKEPKVVKF